MSHRNKLKVSVSVFLCSVLTFTSVSLFFNTERLKKKLHRVSKLNRSKNNLIKVLKDNTDKLKNLKNSLVIEKKIETIRGLHLKEVIDYNQITKENLLKIILKRFREEYPDNAFANMENAYKTIGLLDESIDFKKAVLDIYKEQVAAFYDYHAKKVYTVKNVTFTPNIKNVFLSHEITHTIQDQHYDLIKMGINDKLNEDKVNALTSLLEGDATYCMNEYYNKNAGIGIFLDVVADLLSAFTPKKFDNAPLLLKRTLLFPYIDGLAFVSEIYKGNTDLTMHQVFSDPPKTTEQIIHPEKYFVNRDEPDYPSIPNITSILKENRYKIIYQNTLGELLLQILLESELSKPDTIKAASGWDGDKYVVFEHINDKQTRGFIMISRWDTKNDASEFYQAYLKWLSKKFNLSEKRELYQETFVVSPKHQYYSFVKNKDCIILRTDQATMKKIKTLFFNK